MAARPVGGPVPGVERGVAAWTYAPVASVPPGETAAPVSCTRKAGPYQRQVERWLGLRADGRQSAADCRTIRAFQLGRGIEPAIGFAGPVTWSRTRYRRRARTRTPPDGARPQRAGTAPNTTVRHTVSWPNRNHWSTLYDTPMRVNPTLADARRLWDVLKKGDRVFVWGGRPGT
ncbi:murein L,D-transpeptidase [Streptomyces sp. NPDC052693]|uniref:murein L,D-transpeptidase n=1 Tax=Streptomyces sp. NPDC052693 TaxID=3155814 RepID=UPI00343805AE